MLSRFIQLLVLLAVFTAVAARACSVPVFRYALEHWEADAFNAIVFHRGALTGPQQKIVRDLGTDGLAGRLHANVAVQLVDLDQSPKPEMLALYKQQGGNELPLLVMKFPFATGLSNVIWSGPLSTDTVTSLLESPVRREVVERLAHGQSAVWLLIETGDKTKDDAAAGLVEKRIAYLSTVLTLPKLDEQDIANGLVSVREEDLRLEFSLLRVSRKDAAEQSFVRILLGTERDLDTINEPVVMPVFGRGRALYALVGPGIKDETIDRAASFLIGKCSCQIKEKNPGVDLLLAADWESLIKTTARKDEELPDLAKFAPVTVTISSSSVVKAETPIAYKYVAAGVFIACVIAAGMWLLRRK